MGWVSSLAEVWLRVCCIVLLCQWVTYQKTWIVQITTLLNAVFQYVFSDHVSERNSHHNDSGKVSHQCAILCVSSNWSNQWMPSHRPTHKTLFTTLYHKMSLKVLSVSERLLTYCTYFSHLLHTETRWGQTLACTLKCSVRTSFSVKCTTHVWQRYVFPFVF